MRSLLQRAATLFAPKGGAPAPVVLKGMDARLAKLVARRRAEVVAKALNSLSDKNAEVASKPLYDSSVYHSDDLGLGIETPFGSEDPEADAA
jgi:hypothetical protein